jgi:ketosteroid isomerase-like protein
MKKITVVGLFVLLLSLNFGADAQSERESALQQIAAAENAFADYAAANGTKAAFLKYAASDAIVFNPNPRNAREIWSKKEDKRFLLEWRPHWIDADATGNIGLSTGSWEFSPKAGDASVAWGEFFTIWKRQPNGEWLWVLDVGIDHEKAPVPKNAWNSPKIGAETKSKNGGETWQSLEAHFSQTLSGSVKAGENGVFNAYKTFFSDQVRLLRADHLPFQGKSRAMEFITKQKGTVKTNPLGGEIVSDFAYTHGEYELTLADGKIQKGHFVRTWRHEPKGWRITADFAIPLPKTSK